jgi:peptidoglycan hydrolase-like protein with peptidoglycan-binding domain
LHNTLLTAAAGWALAFLAFPATPPAGTPSKGQSNKTGGSAKAKTATKKTNTSPKQTASRYRRSTQQQPTSERYREIQHALSEKGYFGGTADGNWGPESIEALKRFQRDQNLVDDGKIGSLSLIALGLGPKHEDARVSALPPAAP